MSAQQEYKVRLDVFDGPLDLLLYLIKKDEVDIHDIPIERITNQYMEYLDLMRMLDLNFAGEFLVMAATLMMIKSRMLLPVEEREELEDEEDPRWDLVRQLVEYKKFKDAAVHLQGLEELQQDVFGRDGVGVKLDADADVTLKDVSIFDLISAFNKALSRVKTEDLQEIFADRFTVPEKIDEVLGLLKDDAELSFHQVLKGVRSRHEMVCIFLALLELIRLRQIRARQSEMFGDILICRVEV